MKINRRMRVVAGGLAVAALAVAITTSSVNAASPPPIDASNHHITCTTLYGTFKITPAFDLVGGQPATVAIKAKVDGCIDTDNPNVKLKASTVTGTMVFADNFITALQGVHNVTGSMTVAWKTASGAAKLTNPTSTINFTQLNGGSASVGGNFTDTYANFQIGANAAHGNTAAPTVTGAFTGGDGGATTTLDALGSLSVTAVAGASYLGGTKPVLGAVPLAIGQLHIG
jgi:hypothetical protein